jgi:Zn-dependent protease
MPVDLIYAVAALVIAIVLHELAHGVVAYWLGDTTAKLQGRLTLNPFNHIDKVGSILLPLGLALTELATVGRVIFLFGWARPIPVNTAALQIQGVHNPRRLMALVAIAGPACNFIQAAIGALAIDAGVTWDFLPLYVLINLTLGLFNLIPVPPLDGGRIIVGLLPLAAARAWARLEPYGISVVVLLIFVIPTAAQQFGIHFDPVHDFMNSILSLLGPNYGV